MENWSIEIDGLPNLKIVIFHGYVSHNQMVYSLNYLHSKQPVKHW